MSVPKPLTQAQAAGLLGITERHFRRLLNEPDPPVVVTHETGRARGLPCERYGQWMRRRWQSQLGIADDGSVYDEKLERARLLHHQANIAALDEQVKSRKLIPAEIVLSRWESIAGNVRARLLGLPNKLAAACAGLSRDDIEIKATDLIRQALDELSSDPDY